MGHWSIELHLPTISSSQFDLLERELLSEISEKKLAEFTGNQIGDRDRILFFEAERISSLLKKFNAKLEQHSLEQGAFIVLQEAGTDQRHTIPFEELVTCKIRRSVAGRKWRRPQPGDYYAIPLADGRFGHAQYLVKAPGWGDFVQVANLVCSQPAALEVLAQAQPLFAPVSTDVATCVQRSAWILIGNRHPLVRPETFPLRFSPEANVQCKPSKYHDWIIIYSLTDFRFVGDLQPEYRKFEYQIAWFPEALASRIATGVNPWDEYY